MVRQAIFLQQCLHRAGAPAKTQRIDGQHRDFGIGEITLVAGQPVFALQRLAQNHPEGVAGRYAVAGPPS